MRVLRKDNEVYWAIDCTSKISQDSDQEGSEILTGVLPRGAKSPCTGFSGWNVVE
jgi:hypothetical protein